MKIGIKFFDNDCGTYVRTFLSVLFQLNYGTNYDKVNLVKTFNLVAPELAKLAYLTRNENLHCNNNTDSYFQITTDNVYFDDEIIDYLENEGKYEDNYGQSYYWDNLEFHYIDLETGDITTI